MPGRPGPIWWWTVGVLAAALGANLAAPAVVGAACARALGTTLRTDRVDVAVDAAPRPALWWGRLDRMAVRARDASIGDLRVEAFDASFRGLRIDPRALYADRSFVMLVAPSGVARASIAQAALAGRLSRQPGVHVDVLVLRRGGVRVRGTWRALGAEVAIEGDGRLVLSGGGAIDLILDQATVAGAASPAALKGRLAARVPAVVRIPPLPLGLRLTAIHMDDGRLLLDASTGPS